MNVVECTIPPDVTIERWRRLRRSTAPTQRDPWSRLLAAARRVHSLAYESRFEPSVASVHALHPREGAALDALDRAA
jgi:hypothetical protein